MTLYKMDDKSQIDEFGVDHSNFSLREEIEYNMRRANEKEQQKCLIQQSTPNNVSASNHNLNIRDDNSYQWTVADSYDRRGNLSSVYNNFMKINRENPISPPSSTGNKLLDSTIMRGLAQKYPKTAAMIKAYNLGYVGAGYYDNLRKAYEEAHRYDQKVFFDENNLLQNR